MDVFRSQRKEQFGRFRRQRPGRTFVRPNLRLERIKTMAPIQTVPFQQGLAVVGAKPIMRNIMDFCTDLIQISRVRRDRIRQCRRNQAIDE